MKLVRLLGATAFAMALAACGPEYEETRIELVSSSFPTVENASRSKITLTHGSIMVIRLTVLNDDGEMMPVRFELASRAGSATVATIRNVENRPESYAITGLALGVAQLQIIADDDRVLTINVEVIAQPTPPET